MNTIRIYLTESGRIADLQKDFPLYQGQFQNKLLNVFVPTSILAPMFTSSGAVSADYVASTSTKIGMTYTARDGSIKTSKNYYMRYLKTLMYKGVEYALYERKLPKEFTFYAGQGENSPVLIINVVNIEQQSGDTPPLVLSVITSQTCHLDVMQSTFLDRDELNEPSELENLNAQVQALNAIMPLKQDKEDNNIDLKQKPVQKTVVGAINDLGELVETAQTAADANKAEIGNLSALTTDEKATLVGAINEVDNHADNATTLANNAVATANGAVATANEAKTTAQTAETNANSAVDKATEAQRKAQEAITKAENNVYAVGFMTLQEAITAVNGYDNTVLKTNDNILVVAQGSPDLYVTSVEATNIPYNFTTVDKFNDDLVKNTVLQIGYYKVAFYETDGQPVTVAYQNVVVKSTDWVASTEFADFPYEAKIPLSNFVDYKTVPQVVFDIADTMSGNYAPICKSGDKCVYIYGKVQNEITLKTVITFAPNVNGASVVGGGYNNRGKWVASTTYAIDDLVYTDNGQFVCVEGITSTTSPEQDTTHWQATFVATGKTKNTLTISGQDNGTGVQKTFDGSTAVEIAFDETTMTAKEVNGVLKVGAKGTIPEALPQEASALKSGNLPTSDWTDGDYVTYWTGTVSAYGWEYYTILFQNSSIYSDVVNDIKLVATRGKSTARLYNHGIKQIGAGTPSNPRITGYFFTSSSSYRREDAKIIVTEDGSVYGTGSYSAGSSNSETWRMVGKYEIKSKLYTISDTDITANSDILMELTDDGGVKSYSMEAGSITVIRDAVPTQPIPYTYKVKQTNASGQFTLVNHFVPTIPENPTSLPVSYKKASGSLPTSGWTDGDYVTYWTGTVSVSGQNNYKELFQNSSIYSDVVNNVKLVAKCGNYTGILYNHGIKQIGEGTIYVPFITGYVLSFDSTYKSDNQKIIITEDGKVYGTGSYSAGSSNSETWYMVGKYELKQKLYTISDTDITANTAVKMYLTDEGGVKAQSKASGSITVIRDTVPTVAIPYEYEVEQTSTEGLFEVINAYVPDVPTKTSQLTNDSGFITAADIPSVGEWVDVAGETATLTQAGTYQVIASVNDMQSIVYWDGSTVAYGTKSTAPSVSTSGGTAYLFINCAYPQIDASGTLTVHLLTAGNSSGAWTETDTVQSGFKYRKIN